MKISGSVIRNITTNTKDNFVATYKGKEIIITTNHGHGKPKYDHLTRYDIIVIDLKSGMYDVNTYEDCHTMNDAIRYALKGAILLNDTKTDGLFDKKKYTTNK